jgi:Tol biopolymer transport system component
MDAATGAVTNLTDDAFAGEVSGPTGTPVNVELFIDTAPAWTPDSQHITFARTGWVDNDSTGTSIVQIPANGGEVETLAVLSDTEPFLVTHKTQWSPDGATFYYSLTHDEGGHPDNGIWELDAATGEIRAVAIDGDPQLEPLALLEVAPSGDWLIAWYPEAHNGFQVDQFLPVLIDLKTGETIPVEPPAAYAEEHPGGFTVPTFSPDGALLLGVTSFSEGPGAVWITDLATGEQTLLIDDLDGATVEVGRTPSWATNGLVMTARGSGAGYLLTLTNPS